MLINLYVFRPDKKSISSFLNFNIGSKDTMPSSTGTEYKNN